MITYTKREVFELILGAVFLGVIIGYTFGLIQQTSWKHKAIEEQRYYAE